MYVLFFCMYISASTACVFRSSLYTIVRAWHSLTVHEPFPQGLHATSSYQRPCARCSSTTTVRSNTSGVGGWEGGKVATTVRPQLRSSPMRASGRIHERPHFLSPLPCATPRTHSTVMHFTPFLDFSYNITGAYRNSLEEKLAAALEEIFLPRPLFAESECIASRRPKILYEKSFAPTQYSSTTIIVVSGHEFCTFHL